LRALHLRIIIFYFSAVENANRWPLSSDGLIMNDAEPLLINANKMKLFKSLFYKDALVLKHLNSKSISIKSDKTPHGVTVYTEGFPYLGLWNAKDADFLCIEPWCGIADSVNASGKLEDKEGICHLEKHEKFEKGWSIELF